MFPLRDERAYRLTYTGGSRCAEGTAGITMALLGSALFSPALPVIQHLEQVDLAQAGLLLSSVLSASENGYQLLRETLETCLGLSLVLCRPMQAGTLQRYLYS